jgi:hypothetical protein
VLSKKLLSIAVILLFVTLLTGNSYGQTYVAPQDSQKSNIYLQIRIQNSDGQLVAYLEPTILYVFHPELLDKYLDTKPDKTIITIGGKKFEQIQFEEISKFSITNVISHYKMLSLISGKQETILGFINEGYPVVPGDTVTANWTVIRPIV